MPASEPRGEDSGGAEMSLGAAGKSACATSNLSLYFAQFSNVRTVLLAPARETRLLFEQMQELGAAG
jgi:hypothetical protein